MNGSLNKGLEYYQKAMKLQEEVENKEGRGMSIILLVLRKFSKYQFNRIGIWYTCF